jgi:hypothetical protein
MALVTGNRDSLFAAEVQQIEHEHDDEHEHECSWEHSRTFAGEPFVLSGRYSYCSSEGPTFFFSGSSERFVPPGFSLPDWSRL